MKYTEKKKGKKVDPFFAVTKLRQLLHLKRILVLFKSKIEKKGTL